MGKLVIVKEKVWPALNYRPHPGQVPIHRSKARNKVNAAGRRFGKSQIGGHELVPEAFRAQMNKDLLKELGIRMEFWIVGPNYTDAEKEFRVVYNDIKRLKMPFDRPGTYNDSRSGNMQISLWEGSFLIQAKSAAHPESLVGEGLHGVVMAEAAKMKGSVWTKYVRPTLADFKGWSLWNSTPEGKNHFHDMWQLGQDPLNPDWESWKNPSWMNSFVFRGGCSDAALAALKDKARRPPYTRDEILALVIDEEIVSMYYDLGELMFAQEVECSFTEYTGRVYYDYDEEVHVKSLEYNPGRPLYIATDFGFTNPNVALFIQTDVFDNVYVIGEYYQTHRTDEEFALDIMEDPKLGPLARAAVALYPDPEDPSAANVLSNRWKVSIQGSTGGLLKDRINLIRRWMKIANPHLPYGHPERQPKLFIDRSCRHLMYEMDAYRYPENASEIKEAPENPLKKDDHAPEALSRFFGGYYGTEAVTGRPRQRQARTTRG
jgi:hypothetical protein